jgi:outer membrane immunogenic protein
MVVAFSAFGFASIASAADLPVKAPAAPAPVPFSWTGFYLGGNGGCGVKKESSSAVFEDSDPGEGAFFAFNNKNGGGCFGGVQAGFNYQFPGSSWVIGIEGDWQAGHIQSRGSILEVEQGEIGTEVEPLATYNSNLKQFATVRGRLGYSLPSPTINWLVYATGGWAWGRNEVSGTVFDPSGTFSETKSISGWVAGAGIEAAINRNWSVKFEYLYLDLGDNTYNSFLVSDDGATPGPLSLHTKIHTMRLGFNYRFGDLWVR